MSPHPWKATTTSLGKQSIFILILTSKQKVISSVGRLGQKKSGGVARPHVKRPSTHVVYGHQSKSSVERQRNKLASICNNLLLLANDIESNPGPTIQISTYNISGMKDIDKCRGYSTTLTKVPKEK